MLYSIGFWQLANALAALSLLGIDAAYQGMQSGRVTLLLDHEPLEGEAELLRVYGELITEEVET